MNMDVSREQRTWDAVIVGAGVGGGAAAWTLARAGWSVLVPDVAAGLGPGQSDIP